MSDGTKIEWTDATWSPITGCSVVSAGCKHCYAMKLAGTRLQHHPSRAGLTVDTKNGPVWNGEVRLNEQWLDQPLRWKRPRMVFVCAHADLFHDAVPFEWIDRVFAVMALAKQHTFQVLTKRPARMREWMLRTTDLVLRMNAGDYTIAEKMPHFASSIAHPSGEQNWPLPNVWLGASVENQETANERVAMLLDTPAAVRWISAEPLLGTVELDNIEFEPGNFINALDLEEWRGLEDSPEVQASPGKGALIDWVVVGGESGPNARPMHPAWARSLRDQCAAAGVPFLFKQWGEWAPYNRGRNNGAALATPNSLDEPMQKFGKKYAGRLLDGVQHDGYPGSD